MLKLITNYASRYTQEQINTQVEKDSWMGVVAGSGAPSESSSLEDWMKAISLCASEPERNGAWTIKPRTSMMVPAFLTCIMEAPPYIFLDDASDTLETVSTIFFSSASKVACSLVWILVAAASKSAAWM